MITPNEYFFVRNHLPVPRVDLNTYLVLVSSFPYFFIFTVSSFFFFFFSSFSSIRGKHIISDIITSVYDHKSNHSAGVDFLFIYLISLLFASINALKNLAFIRGVWQRKIYNFSPKKSTRSKAGQMCWFKAPVPRVRGFKSHRVHSFFSPFLFYLGLRWLYKERQNPIKGEKMHQEVQFLSRFLLLLCVPEHERFMSCQL
jgi:hypothetical protein